MQLKRMNWLQKRPLWQVNQAWRERRALMRQDFEARNAALINGFSAANSNQLKGMVEITMQSALTRIREQTSAKIKQALDIKL